MAIEVEIDVRNGWGYFYCTVCECVALIGDPMTLDDIDREEEFFRKMHESHV